jgi:Asp-tRNA(Asn)/Glu-tRNA(Gln) amidotransferase A subunit family amidase
LTDLAFVSAVEQARMVRDKEISPVELVDLYLARIDKYDGEINAYVTVVGDQAREQAARAEQEVIDGADLGPFHGVPIPIKDLFETQGIKTTFSCRALADLVPDQDDNVVVKIKQAGAIVIGKTNTSEFGSVPMTESQLNGITRNPWDHAVTAGGSSGGAAAAVAAGLAPVAQGSDGGGSIRVPASCCGLFGLKPSRGRISAGPRLGEHWHGFSTSGALGHTVTDVAALIDVMSGYMTGDPYSAPTPVRPFVQEVGADPGKLRIGFTSKSPNELDVHPDCLEALGSAARLLESLGHEVIEAEPANWVDQSLQPHFVQLISTGTAVLDFLPHDQLEPLNRYLVESARQIDSTTHIQALLAMHQWTRQICAWWDEFDILLTPTTAMPPVENGWVFSDDDPFMALVRSGQFIPFTPPLNVTGQPAASVPLHRNAQGLPIGIQIVGAPYRDDVVLRLAGQLEEASPWAGNHPEMP